MTTVYNPSERDLLLEDGADCQHQGGCVILELEMSVLRRTASP